LPRTAGSGGPDVVGSSHAPHPRHTGTWILRTNTMSFYLRSRLVLDADALHVTTPRTILGLVPIGTRTWDIPLERLAGVRITVVVRIERVLVAAALLAVAIFVGLPWLATMALAAVAAILLFLGVALGMRMKDRDGARLTVPVCVLQRGVAAAALRQIERAIAARSGP
jgi:hypothetical protein